MVGPLDISVIICTRNRAESLRETLRCLAAADRSGLTIEVVVVDNGSDDDTCDVARAWSKQLAIRYIVEKTVGRYGKSHALNAALDVGGLGELIVVLDDDISVEAEWWRGVQTISNRWPNADLFSGRAYIVWPDCEIPEWARHGGLNGWLFSVADCGSTDHLLTSRRWFLGGFFWFRSRVLQTGRRFPDTWFTEPQFQLQLVEEGCIGVQGPDAVVGHRIQPALLEPDRALVRAPEAGKGFAQARLVPYRASVRNARWARQHPLAARVYCVLAWLYWSWLVRRLRNVGGNSAKFAERLIAIERCFNYRETLRILGSNEAYGLRLWMLRAQAAPKECDE